MNDMDDDFKENIKKKIKNKIKREIIEEIYQELKAEENEITDEISSLISNKITMEKFESVGNEEPIEISEPLKKKVSVSDKKSEESTSISVKAILKIASHALKYAHSKILKHEWVEVIGLLAGYVEYDGEYLYIEDAYPMGHGTAIHADIKDYKNYVRAFNDIKKNNLFICGWYHSHPSYGPFMSNEDMGTQSRYQKLWDKAVALVIDPYQIDGTSLGFEIFRANLNTNKWHSIPFKVKGDLDVSMMPEILDFLNPVIEGKPAYLEYDED
jgi:proteasome lid subunit RPN8/RPN11